MSDTPDKDPQWLDEFEQLANNELGEGSACEQIHPIVERWFTGLLDGDPPQDKPSIEQAMVCLTTEVLNTLPEEALEAVKGAMDEEDFAEWVEMVLLIGRSFEKALKKGDLDDL